MCVPQPALWLYGCYNQHLRFKAVYRWTKSSQWKKACSSTRARGKNFNKHQHMQTRDFFVSQRPKEKGKRHITTDSSKHDDQEAWWQEESQRNETRRGTMRSKEMLSGICNYTSTQIITKYSILKSVNICCYVCQGNQQLYIHYNVHIIKHTYTCIFRQLVSVYFWTWFILEFLLSQIEYNTPRWLHKTIPKSFILKSQSYTVYKHSESAWRTWEWSCAHNNSYWVNHLLVGTVSPSLVHVSLLQTKCGSVVHVYQLFQPQQILQCLK